MTLQQQNLITALQKEPDYLSGDVHQAIMNIGYSEWQHIPDWEYREMIYWTEKKFGKLAALAILIGKYNQQVCNGGHIQYFDNGYTDGKGGFTGDHSTDIDLHIKLIELYKEQSFKDQFSTGQTVLTILEQVHYEKDEQYCITELCESGGDGEDGLCIDCGGTGEDEYQNPDYNTVVNTYLLKELDDQWYTIDQQFIQEFNEYLAKEII
jgi:hypothetical protein